MPSNLYQGNGFKMTQFHIPYSWKKINSGPWVEWLTWLIYNFLIKTAAVGILSIMCTSPLAIFLRGPEKRYHNSGVTWSFLSCSISCLNSKVVTASHQWQTDQHFLLTNHILQCVIQPCNVVLHVYASVVWVTKLLWTFLLEWIKSRQTF